MALALALAVNVIVVPAAVALTAWLRLDGPIAYRLILAAAAPGGGPVRCWPITPTGTWHWE